LKRDTGRGPRKPREEAESEWIEKVVQIRRVTKVVKGGKKLSFRAIVVVGNGKGQVGIGVGKSAEVIGAIQKGVTDAKKQLVSVPLVGTTIPHPITAQAGAGSVMLKPASKGTGVIAGGAVRTVLEAAGIKDICAKSLGSDSPLNNARAAMKALTMLRTVEDVARMRGLEPAQILH
jgi:small subunit ribosomal protein S5